MSNFIKSLFILIFTSFFTLSCTHGIPEDWDKTVNPKYSAFLIADPLNWTKSFPGFRVIGNLYGVGTYDLSVFLITSEEGHILINTGVAGSFHQIKDNIETLGFRTEDIKILLTMQAHWDHVAELARIKNLTEASLLATQKDARVLEDGGMSDAHFGGEVLFRPVKVDKIITEGEVISLGDINLIVHEHPGHTEGSSSYSMEVKENNETYNVAIVNMGTINTGKVLTGDSTYPGVSKDFFSTYQKQKAMKVDVWVSAHGSQYNLHDKYSPGQIYSANTFIDPQGFLKAINKYEDIYLKQIEEEERSE